MMDRRAFIELMTAMVTAGMLDPTALVDAHMDAMPGTFPSAPDAQLWIGDWEVENIIDLQASVESQLEETTKLGDRYESWRPTGRYQSFEVEVRAYWQEAGSHARMVLMQNGPLDVRVVVRTKKQSLTVTAKAYMVSYEIVAEQASVTEVRFKLKIAGEVETMVGTVVTKTEVVA